MKRIFHPYWDWEDYKAGMWRIVPRSEAEMILPRAVEFTGDAELYGSFMRRVSTEWTTACEHNLTDVGINRKAWIGHAACCLAIGAPEQITRAAWWILSQDQRDAANQEADEAIKAWEVVHERKNQVVHRQMALSGIFGRHS